MEKKDKIKLLQWIPLIPFMGLAVSIGFVIAGSLWLIPVTIIVIAPLACTIAWLCGRKVRKLKRDEAVK